jgi:hypothetical protein
MAYQAPIAPNGSRIRNLCLMAESVMSDARHTFLSQRLTIWEFLDIQHIGG